MTAEFESENYARREDGQPTKRAATRINLEDEQPIKQAATRINLEDEQPTKQAESLEREGMTDEEYIALLETKLGEALASANECKVVAQRLQADFDNFRKRNANVYEESRAFGQSMVIEKLLTVLDNCDLARKYLTDEAALTGFNMMETQILNALSGFGLKEIEADGKDFDAKFMNAIEREKSEEFKGKVIQVLQKGYTISGKLLRPANVKVGYFE